MTVASAKLRHFKANFKFLGPFERYKLVRPFVRAKEQKLAEERAKQEKEAQKKNEKNATERTDEERIESVSDRALKLGKCV